MASQANTFGPRGGEFVSDTTPQTVTLNVAGGTVTNVGGTAAWINYDTNPTTSDGNNPGNFPLAANATLKLAADATSFKHATAAGSTFLIYQGKL